MASSGDGTMFGGRKSKPNTIIEGMTRETKMGTREGYQETVIHITLG